jgi:hypothetical protein
MSSDQIELSRLLKSQYKQLYIPVGDTNFVSHFFKGFNHTIWNSIVRKPLDVKSNPHSKMDHLRRNHGIVDASYTIDQSYDFLIRTVVTMETPRITVNPKYTGRIRFKWCKYPGPSACFHNAFKYGDEIIEEFPSQWIKTFFNWGYGSEYSESINNSTGNISKLTEWATNEIPKSELRFTIPYFYNRPEDKLTTSFPMFLLGTKTELTKKMKYPSDIVRSLLMIEINRDGVEWKQVPKSGYDKLIDIQKLISIGSVMSPTLEAKYAKVTEEEKWRIMHRRTLKGDKYVDEPIDEFVYPMQRVTTIYDCDFTRPGKTSTHKINLSPTAAFFCNGINGDALESGESSNYTTNSDNPANGLSAISKIQVKYDMAIKETIYPSMMKSMDVHENLPGVPRLSGSFYNTWTHRPLKTDGMIGVILDSQDDCSVVCTYTSNIPKNKEIVMDGESKDNDATSILDSLMEEESDTVYDDSSIIRTGYITELFVITHSNMIFTYANTIDGRRVYTMSIPNSMNTK